MKKISSKEVEQAKEQCIGKWNVQNEQSDATATNLFLEETVGKAEDYYRYPEFIRDVTLSDVLKLVRIKN
jgi:predicted Zn-dependent peptidase